MKDKKILREKMVGVGPLLPFVIVAIIAILAAVLIRPVNKPTEITPTAETISPAPVARENKTNATNRVDIEFTGVRPTIKD